MGGLGERLCRWVGVSGTRGRVAGVARGAGGPLPH